MTFKYGHEPIRFVSKVKHVHTLFLSKCRYAGGVHRALCRLQGLVCMVLPWCCVDLADTGDSYTKLHNFGASNGTPFCDFRREFRGVVSAATGTERVLTQEVQVILEVVRMAINEQYPSLMPTLYPGALATVPRSFGTLDAMWVGISNSCEQEDTCHQRRTIVFFPCFFEGWPVICPVGAPARE